MMQTASIADNISDVLMKIICFTRLRRRVLHKNLHQADAVAFVPQDLPVHEFAEILNGALAEHLQHHRLLFRDTPNVKFGPRGTMEIRPIADPRAHALRQTNRDEYTGLQINKLLENCLNRRIAEELLRKKCGVPVGPLARTIEPPSAGDGPWESLTPDRDPTD
jgi:hypothetical protein